MMSSMKNVNLAMPFFFIQVMSQISISVANKLEIFTLCVEQTIIKRTFYKPKNPFNCIYMRLVKGLHVPIN
jgi:hypothetical protein